MIEVCGLLSSPYVLFPSLRPLCFVIRRSYYIRLVSRNILIPILYCLVVHSVYYQPVWVRVTQRLHHNVHSRSVIFFLITFILFESCGCNLAHLQTSWLLSSPASIRNISLLEPKLQQFSGFQRPLGP